MTVFTFASYRFDAASMQLIKGDEVVPLRSKASKVLGYLLEHRHETVTKQRLLETIWSGEQVSENVLFQVIYELRQLLAQGGEDVTYIKTFPKKGFQWVYSVTVVDLDSWAVSKNHTETQNHQSERNLLANPPAKRKYFHILAGALGIAVLFALVFMGVQYLGTKSDTSVSTAVIFSFQNLSEQEDKDWIGAALAEGIRADMNRISGVYALSGEDCHQLQADLELTLGETFSRELLEQISSYGQCRYVITGTFQKSGSDLQVKWHLRDLLDSQWKSGLIKGDREDLSGLLTQTADAIRNAMGRLTLGPSLEAVTLPVRGESLKFYSEGLRHLQLMEASSAIAFLEKSLLEDPDALSTKLRLSQAYNQLGDRKRAEQTALQAVADAKVMGRKNQLMALANLLEIRQEWDKATEPFQALWLMDPGNTDLGIRATKIHIEAGDADAAERNLAKLRSTLKRDPRLDFLAFSIAAIRGEPEQQLEAAKAGTAQAELLGARSLEARGLLLHSQALSVAERNDEALQKAEEAAEYYRDLGQFPGFSQALVVLGDIHNKRGAIKDAEPFFIEALEHFQKLGDRDGVGETRLKLAVIHWRKRQFQEANRLANLAIEHFRQSGSRQLAGALGVSGLVNSSLGELEEAVKRLEESNFHHRKVGADYRIALNNCNLANIYLRQGQMKQAVRQYEVALDLAKKSGKKTNLGSILHNLGQLYFKQGRLTEAERCFQEAIELEVGSNRQITAAGNQYRLALLRFEMGEYVRAEESILLAKASYEALERPLDAYLSSRVIGAIRLFHGKTAEAELIGDEGFEALRENNSSFYVQALLFKASLAFHQGKYPQALTWIEEVFSPERKRRTRRQLLEGYYLKASILIALDRLQEGEKIIDDAESSRMNYKSVFFDMEKEYLQAAVLAKKGEVALAELQLDRLVERAREMGAKHMMSRVETRLTDLRATVNKTEFQP